MLTTHGEKTAMKEILVLVGFLVIWFVLNAWVLPRFGVKT